MLHGSYIMPEQFCAHDSVYVHVCILAFMYTECTDCTHSYMDADILRCLRARG